MNNIPKRGPHPACACLDHTHARTPARTQQTIDDLVGWSPAYT